MSIERLSYGSLVDVDYCVYTKQTSIFRRICNSQAFNWRGGDGASNFQVSGLGRSNKCDWKNYFSQPDMWWNNCSTKMNPKAVDFKHKVSKKAL